MPAACSQRAIATSRLAYPRVVAEEDDRALPALGLVEHDGHRAVDVPAKPHPRAAGAFRRAEPPVEQHAPSQPDRHARPFGPDELPPPVLRNRPELAAPLADRHVPRRVRGHADLAVHLEAVAVVDEAGDMLVERLERRVGADPLAPEVGGEAVLPDEVHALDLPLGLRRVREHERYVEELQPPAELRELAVLAPEEPCLVHVYLERQPVAGEDPVEQVQVRWDALARVETASDLHAAAVVEHVQKLVHGPVPAEEPVRRRVELPQLADRPPLPPPDVGGRARLRNGDLDSVVDGPVAHLAAVDRMPEQPAKLACREGVRVPFRLAARAEHAPEEALFLLWPGCRMVPAGSPGDPRVCRSRRARGKERGLELVQPGLADLQFGHRLRELDFARYQLHDRVAHMGDTQPLR